MEKVIVETQSGVYASNFEEIEAAVLSYYDQYKRGGALPYQGVVAEIEQYSYRELARRVAGILSSGSEGDGGGCGDSV